ncbi:MAG: hypothetical protein ACYDD4_07310 [Acidimicrobiales bacterium]
MAEAWRTDEELAAAAERFAATVPGYRLPAAHGVARVDGDTLTFGHVNDFGSARPLPAAVLASVCGHHGSTAAYHIDRASFERAIELLAPAEAATHMPHPNLWSGRELLAGAGPDSSFVVFFVQDPDDEPVDEFDDRFRALLTPSRPES